MKNLVYQAIDEKLTNGISYYRIKAISTTDNHTYSKIIILENTNSNINYTISPNPAKDFFTVSGDSIKKVEVMNGVEKVIKSVTFNNASNPTIDIDGLAAGFYFVLITNEHGKTQAKRMVVK